jgi:hypothetical protein
MSTYVIGLEEAKQLASCIVYVLIHLRPVVQSNFDERDSLKREEAYMRGKFCAF